MKKDHLLFSILIFQLLFIGCDNSTEQELLFVAEDRYSDDFGFQPSINKIVVTNPIGFTYLFGNTDTTRISYVIDRSAWAKTKELAQNELSKIDLEHSVENDSLFCNITYPYNLGNAYDCTLNLDVPYKKDVVIKIPNKGIHSAYLYSDLATQTEGYETTIEQHTGSIEATSTTGNINAVLILPANGYCICYSQSGDIIIKIPQNTSANVHLKTSTGSFTYVNLNLTIVSSNNQELTGVLGTGYGEINLESLSGNITLEGF